MTIIDAIVLGILQGLTEFLPVSSSGHLVLMQQFLGLKEPQVFFGVMLHVGTLGAVVVVYRRSIWSLTRTSISTSVSGGFYRHPISTINDNRNLKLVWFILIGSIPTGIIAILFKDGFESLFAKPEVVATMLIVTGLLLQLPRLKRAKMHGNLPLQTWHAPLIGIAQGFAITPGISRSGSTISLSLMLGISPQTAAQYSFLLAIPAILGALLLKLEDALKGVVEVTLVPTIIGTLTAFVAGYIALRILLTTLNRGKFSLFSYYCFALGGVVFIKMAW